MSVYVDPLFPTPGGWRSPRRGYKEACHLFADTPEELHAFAAAIGLRRSYAQGGPGTRHMLHYDLTPNKRRQAVKAGAVELTRETRKIIVERHRAAREDAKKCRS